MAEHLRAARRATDRRQSGCEVDRTAWQRHCQLQRPDLPLDDRTNSVAAQGGVFDEGR
jgi:hypothetical protein